MIENNHQWEKAETIEIGIRNIKPLILIRKNGGVHLNSALVRKYNLHNKYVEVKILSEENKSIIGFVFTDKKRDNLLTLAFGKDKKNASFSGRSIFTKAKFDVKRKAPISIEPKIEEYEGNKIFVIELKKD